MGDLSTHFSTREFTCHCGCGLCDIDPELIDRLEALRSMIGNRAILINSGHRCAQHNADIGGSPRSQHLLGKAADIRVSGIPARRVADVAETLFRNGGLGRYATFTHVDVRGYKARWKY